MFSSPKLFLWTLYCAHWCFFLSLHEWWADIHMYIYSVTRFNTVIAPLSNLWPEGVLVPPITHRIPSNHPSLICKIDWLLPEAVVESDKSNQGKLLFVSSDQSIYGGIVWCCIIWENVLNGNSQLWWYVQMLASKTKQKTNKQTNQTKTKNSKGWVEGEGRCRCE